MLKIRNLVLSAILMASASTSFAGTIFKSEYTVKNGDALISILNKNKIKKEDVHNLIYNTKNIEDVNNLKIGQDLVIYKRANGELEKLIFEVDNKNVIVASRSQSGDFSLKKGMYKLNKVNRYKVGIVRYNLNKTLTEMGLTNEQKDQFKDMFKSQLDINKLNKGAKIVAVYDEFYKGKSLQYTGALVAGEIDQSNNSYQAFLFKDHEGNDGYFAKNGRPLSEGFDVSPIKDYKRISSKFTKSRKHPVLGRVRAHKGVDYAAKTGTPIYAAASGKISMKDYQKRGYGNVIVIDHSDGYSTLYAHMKRVEKGIRAGKHVEKGDVIGYVGTSGLSTGPHLHFEVRKNGKHLDPLNADLPTGAKLARKDVAKFKTLVDKQVDGFKIAKMINEKEGKTSVAIRLK